jgi:transcriptional regulator with XRE-family HTH domain
MTETMALRLRFGRPARSSRGTDDVDLHVGSRMRLRRAELGISQQDLAERVGIAFQQIQKYEVGRNRVSAGRLFDIGRALGVPVSYFFAGLGPEPVGPQEGAAGRSSLSRIVNDPTMIRLLSIMSREQTDDEFKKGAAEIVRVVADTTAAQRAAARSMQ